MSDDATMTDADVPDVPEGTTSSQLSKEAPKPSSQWFYHTEELLAMQVAFSADRLSCLLTFCTGWKYTIQGPCQSAFI